jgi:hypothetical protein
MIEKGFKGSVIGESLHELLTGKGNLAWSEDAAIKRLLIWQTSADMKTEGLRKSLLLPRKSRLIATVPLD